MGIIISGFAGIGKTTLQKNNSNVIDLESSDFKWIYQNSENESMDKEKRKGVSNRIQNPLWPLNYVNEIIKKASEYDIVLISQDLDMRNCLRNHGCMYYVCFPRKECKQEYLERYKNRGNNEKFISIVNENFENWIEALMKEDNKIIMEPGEYLEDTLIRYEMISKKISKSK
jgi:adenylate kinase family enzyme